MFRAISTFLLSIFGLPCHACALAASMDFRDILQADAVVRGLVTKYEIVNGGGPGPLSDYARFQIFIEGIYKSDPAISGSRLTFTWDNSTFGEPKDLAGQEFIFALRRATSKGLPLRAPSATILSVPEPDLLTILQAPCAGAFIFKVGGSVQRAVEMVFDGKGDAKIEADVLAEYLGMFGGSGLY